MLAYKYHYYVSGVLLNLHTLHHFVLNSMRKASALFLSHSPDNAM